MPIRAYGGDYHHLAAVVGEDHRPMTWTAGVVVVCCDHRQIEGKDAEVVRLPQGEWSRRDVLGPQHAGTSGSF